MNIGQLRAVFRTIQPHAGDPPYRIGVLMMNGQQFAGLAYPPDGNGLMRLDVERIAEAHLMKPPTMIWIDVAAIQAVTDNDFFAVVPALERQAGETAGTETETEGKSDHVGQV
jgi:hypothetical protein